MGDEWILIFDTETTGIGPDEIYFKKLGYYGKDAIEEDLAYGKRWEEKNKMLGAANQWIDDPSGKTNIQMWDESKTYIAQLSYILYNVTTNESKIYNKYIRDIPSDIVSYLLSKAAPSVEAYKADMKKFSRDRQYTHEITVTTLRKMLDAGPEETTTISDAMNEFVEDFRKSTVVVGHNANFDRRLVFCELTRLKRSLGGPYEVLFNELKNNANKFYCTMCAGKQIARIDTSIRSDETVPDKKIRVPYEGRKGPPRDPSDPTRAASKFAKWTVIDPPGSVKPPALWELYDRLFGYPPNDEALHDAIVDVVVTLRVFYRLWMTGNKNPSEPIRFEICGKGEPDIYGKDKSGRITDYIKKITPAGVDPRGNFSEPSGSLGPCSKEGVPYSRIPGDPVLPLSELQEGVFLRSSSKSGGKKRKAKKVTKRKRLLRNTTKKKSFRSKRK